MVPPQLYVKMTNRISELKRWLFLCLSLAIYVLTLYVYMNASDQHTSNAKKLGSFISPKADKSRGLPNTERIRKPTNKVDKVNGVLFEQRNKTNNRITETRKLGNLTSSNILFSYAEMSNLTGTCALPVSLNGSYTLENPNLCKSVNDLLLLIVVYSAPTYFEKRRVLRTTWLNQKHLLAFGRTRVVFIMGETDPATQNKIKQEMKAHGDILQGDFRDTYRNLTEKGVMMYKWILERCKNAKLILKTDDDVVINIFNLFQYLVPYLNGKSKRVICKYNINSRIRRDEKEKWFIAGNIFPNQSVYPPYCSGFFVLFTNDLTPLLFETIKSTPFFWLEDVYLYGLLYQGIQGIQIENMKRGTFSICKKKALRCFNQTSWEPENCMYVIVAANLDMPFSEIYWNEFVQSATNALLTQNRSISHIHADPVLHTGFLDK